MFVVAKRAIGDVEPLEYIAGAAGLTVGMAATLTSGALAKCAATAKPTHIIMGDAENGVYPCIRVLPTTTFAVAESVAVPATAVGSAVTIGSDALSVTATTTSGVFTVTATDATANGTCEGYFA